MIYYNNNAELRGKCNNLMAHYILMDLFIYYKGPITHYIDLLNISETRIYYINIIIHTLKSLINNNNKIT